MAQATETIRVTMGDEPMPKEDLDWVVREFRRILGEAEGWYEPIGLEALDDVAS